MIRVLKWLIYMCKRGGFLFTLFVILAKLGLLSESDVFSNKKINKRFYSYFLNLREDQYYNELMMQIDIFFAHFKGIDISQPKTFTEKIQWLKINDCSGIKTVLADKYSVREWVSKKIGIEYLIPLVGGPWKNADSIDFSKLPNKFVLKCTTGSGMNEIIKNKSDLTYKELQEIKVRANKWLNTMFGWKGMQTQYFRIENQIIAEEYIEQMDGDLCDYKFFCFNGKPEFIQIIWNRNNLTKGYQALFDLNWNRMPFNDEGYNEFVGDIIKPNKLDEMILLAGKLSSSFIFVRVDLYLVNDEIKFGEMTFTPSNGFSKWEPKSANLFMGSKIHV